MANKIVYCFVLGDTGNTFLVTIAEPTTLINNNEHPINDITVAFFKDLIWDKKGSVLKTSRPGITSDMLDLWKVEIEETATNIKLLKNTETDIEKAFEGEKLTTFEKINEIFPKPSPKYIHIIMQPPLSATTEHKQKKGAFGIEILRKHLLFKHDLFKDLYIYQHPPEIYVKSIIRKWNESDLPLIPVIRLDFSVLTLNEGSEMLRNELIQLLKSIGESYGITLKLDSVKGITKELITTLAGHEENMYEKVVILINEYDSPILNAFDAMKESLTIADHNHGVLKGFFEMLKSSQQYIKFCFVTGVTMFSNMELFSGANQLTDMTMRDKLSDAYGFMEDEIVKAFEFSGGYDIKETMTKLRERYNGYFWDGQTKVYNPYSVCSFFDAYQLENFWIKKGRTSFLAKLISIEHIKNITSETTIKKDFIIPVSIESIMNSTPPISLLFQAGYLTIKRTIGEDLFLEIPNHEVRDSLMSELWSNSLGVTIEKAFKI
ncbi:16348_t:CDS:2 [Funneliformis geosporum]|uniref:16348_t:CDS:1 n=1 Tax=Funneliformis geosporum TaxID=1117311 RepID=A0A9W4WWW9_9GLOM|nr:16348_t:CDS:2 [Funneliformis geosporum]